MTVTDAPAASKNKRRLLAVIVVAVLLIGGGTAGWFSWNAAGKHPQAEARAAEQQRAQDEAAAKKKAASEAYWAKVYKEEAASKAKFEAEAAAKASADRAAAARSLATRRGWTEKTTGIYFAESPDTTCSYSACSKFNVMTTLERGCPNGVAIRGRWLTGQTVTGTVFEVTGPLYANEQAAVETNDYSDKANRIELTEFVCQ